MNPRQFTILGTALTLGVCSALRAAAPAAVPLGACGSALPSPTRVAAGANGRIYVTAMQAGQVSVLDAFGRVTDVRTGFAQPVAVAVDSGGSVYLGEAGNGSVSVWDSHWKQVSKLGQGEGEFLLPADIALDPASGDVFVCDSRAHQIKIYHAGQRTGAFGSYGTGAGQFDFPAGLCVTAGGEVWVVDQNNDRVEIFSRSGSFLRTFALGGSSSGSLGGSRSGRSQGITSDSAGHIYVADTYQGFIRVFDAEGNSLSTLGSYGEKAGQFRSPVHLARDPYGRLLVASANNARIELIGLDNYVQLLATPSRPVIASGTPASFSIALSGPGPFSYQWRKDGQILPGATAQALSLATATAADSGVYSVAVSGPTGSFVSPEASLTVQAAPRVVENPASQAVVLGTPVVFEPVITGDALTFQWQRNGQNIPAATSRTLAVPGAQLADAGSYRLLVTNLVGNAATEVAQLTVFIPPAPPQIDSVSLQPGSGVQLLFRCEPGYSYTIDASTDLAEWTTLTTMFTETDSVGFSDPEAGGYPNRFYRLRWAPTTASGGFLAP